jgi:hypothetical protein
MADRIPQPRPPGTEIVPRSRDAGGAGVPRQLLLATDFAVGAAAQATGLALRLGALAWDAGAAVGHVVSAMPGADGAGRLLGNAARPLADDGQEVRARALSAAQGGMQRLLEAFLPGVLDALDLDALVQRIDIDRLVQRMDVERLVQHIDIDELVGRIEIDALVERIDIDRLVRRIEIDDVVARIDIDALVKRIDIDELVRRIEIDALVQRIDIDALVGRIDIDRLVRRIEIDDVVRRIEIDALVERIDVDAVVERIDVGSIVDRVDVNEVVQRVDVDAIVEETELGTIVARSTSGFASAAVDATRNQTVGVDTRVSRVVNRLLRRKEGEVPAGPPLLTGETDAEPEEPRAPRTPGGEPER